MPLPLIIGAAALAAATYGAKKGYDGYQRHSEADDIIEGAKFRYESKKTVHDEQEKETLVSLDQLGQLELDIGKSFGEFKTLADELIKALNRGRGSDEKLKISIPRYQLQKIASYTYSAVGVIGSAVGAGAAGAAAGFAVYGGVMAMGAASTGTAISSLAGAAATKATLAAIGGGSLATGGLGIVGGTAILGGAVAAPVLLIAGWAYNSHGEKAVENAYKVNREVDEAVEKLSRAIDSLVKTEEYTRKLKRSLFSIYVQFTHYLDVLKGINQFIEDLQGRNVDVDAEIGKFGDQIMQSIENGYALAAILTNVITTPLFKLEEKDGAPVTNEEGVPHMFTDADGFRVVNTEALDAVLNTAKEQARNYTLA